jgi:transcriptional regulator with XRE-family HTH domain
MVAVTYVALGARLRAGREARHWTQEWVAAELGVEQGLISLYERGMVRPGPDRLVRYAVVVGIDAAELFGLAGYAWPPPAH